MDDFKKWWNNSKEWCENACGKTPDLIGVDFALYHYEHGTTSDEFASIMAQLISE